MDVTQRLIDLCRRVVEAGTGVPGDWAMNQRPLVEFCRATMQELGEAMAKGTAKP